jgi:hypothetical protein
LYAFAGFRVVPAVFWAESGLEMGFGCMARKLIHFPGSFDDNNQHNYE